MKGVETRTIDLFGPQFLIETGGPVGVAGQSVYVMSAINESGIRYVQGLYQSGLSKINVGFNPQLLKTNSSSSFISTVICSGSFLIGIFSE